MGAKSAAARAGVFSCPPDLDALYRELVSSIGRGAAREKIRDIVRQRAIEQTRREH